MNPALTNEKGWTVEFELESFRPEICQTYPVGSLRFREETPDRDRAVLNATVRALDVVDKGFLRDPKVTPWMGE